MLEAVVYLLRMLGMPTSSSIVLATLLAESRPMGLDELCERTGYAKSHLSASLRLLEERRLVERVAAKGRRVLFRVREGALSRLLHEHLSELSHSIRRVVEEGREIGVGEKLGRLERELRRVLEEVGGGGA